MVQMKNNIKNNKITMGCGYIQNDNIFRIGLAQIRLTSMNKRGDGKGISWIARICRLNDKACRSCQNSWRKLRPQTQIDAYS